MNAVLAAVVNGALLSALIVGAVWFALRAVPRRTLNAATRYVLWWVVLAIAIALPGSSLSPGRRHRHFHRGCRRRRPRGHTRLEPKAQ